MVDTDSRSWYNGGRSRVRYLWVLSREGANHGSLQQDCGVWKETDTNWRWKIIAGALADSRECTGSGYWVLSDDRKTFYVTGDMVVGGEKMPTFDDAYTRLPK